MFARGSLAVVLSRSHHNIVRRVTIVDSDIGVVIMAGGHNTVSGVTLKAHWRTGGETGETGHYGFGVRGHAQDNLVQDSTPDKFPQINVIGVDKRPTQKTATDAWIERWPGETTVPLNLYEAQRAHRLDKTATTPREGEKKP